MTSCIGTTAARLTSSSVFSKPRPLRLRRFRKRLRRRLFLLRPRRAKRPDRRSLRLAAFPTSRYRPPPSGRNALLHARAPAAFPHRSAAHAFRRSGRHSAPRARLQALHPAIHAARLAPRSRIAARRLRRHAPRPLERPLLRALRQIDLFVVRESRRWRDQRPVSQPRRCPALPQKHHSPSRLRPICFRRFIRSSPAWQRRTHRRRPHQRSFPRRRPHYADLRPPRLSGTRPRPHADANLRRSPALHEIPRTHPHRNRAKPLRRPALRKTQLHHHPHLHRRRLAPLTTSAWGAACLPQASTAAPQVRNHRSNWIIVSICPSIAALLLRPTTWILIKTLRAGSPASLPTSISGSPSPSWSRACSSCTR